MTQVEKIKEMLLREFGIRSEEELMDAMRKEKKVNLGIFVSPLWDEKNEGRLEGKDDEKGRGVAQKKVLLHTGSAYWSSTYAGRNRGCI